LMNDVWRYTEQDFMKEFFTKLKLTFNFILQRIYEAILFRYLKNRIFIDEILCISLFQRTCMYKNDNDYFSAQIIKSS
jgi:hypothetical protein